jgi:hypothetical protein
MLVKAARRPNPRGVLTVLQSGFINMQCPHCSALCANADVICPACRHSLGKGLTQAKLANLTAAVFGVLMIAFLVYVNASRPAVRSDERLAMQITNALFVGASVVVGRIVGWLLGAFICRA